MLGGNSIGDVTNRVPFEMLLTQNNHLEILDVGNNEIGDATAKHIAAGLAKNTALRSLEVRVFATQKPTTASYLPAYAAKLQ